jgi:hypothetical protein
MVGSKMSSLKLYFSLSGIVPKKETLKMDLWTKEMPIDEMKSFMLQTFVSMKNSIS